MAVDEKLSRLATRLRELKDRKEELDAELSKIYWEAKEIQEQLIPRLMEDAEIEKFTVPDVGTVYIKQVIYAAMAKDEGGGEPPFYAWAREHAPDLIVPYIHPKRLNAWAKERLEQGLPVPDNSLKAQFVPTATLLRK